VVTTPVIYCSQICQWSITCCSSPGSGFGSLSSCGLSCHEPQTSPTPVKQLLTRSVRALCCYYWRMEALLSIHSLIQSVC